MCIYLWILFTSATCLQVLDQIIEDRKRRVQLQVLLLVLLQLLSIFLLHSSIFAECCSVHWKIVFYLLLLGLFWVLSLNIGGVVVHTKMLN